ncbi:cornichon protein-domain-containing protein [Mycena olivaceomarginata]|nr:cornichon protein-domain-containing protein [Mycena olivaceomarginata]
MPIAAWLFIFALLLAAGLMFCAVFFVIMFSEFEQQLISEEHLCDTLNNFVAPDLFGPALLVVLFLVSRNWVACLLNIPVAAYNINKLQTGRHFFGGIKPKVHTRAQRRSIPPALRVSETQERELHQDRVLSFVILLLSLSDDSRIDQWRLAQYRQV